LSWLTNQSNLELAFRGQDPHERQAH